MIWADQLVRSDQLSSFLWPVQCSAAVWAQLMAACVLLAYSRMLAFTGQGRGDKRANHSSYSSRSNDNVSSVTPKMRSFIRLLCLLALFRNEWKGNFLFENRQWPGIACFMWKSCLLQSRAIVKAIRKSRSYIVIALVHIYYCHLYSPYYLCRQAPAPGFMSGSATTSLLQKEEDERQELHFTDHSDSSVTKSSSKASKLYLLIMLAHHKATTWHVCSISKRCFINFDLYHAFVCM